MTALGALTTRDADALREHVVLLPVGSVEPHGPHLPLETDTIISQAACELAVQRLAVHGLAAVVAPAIPYGVTDFAGGFAGAVSVPAAALRAFLRAVVEAHLASGARHVCIVNNHLEPAHDAAVRASIDGLANERASVACPLTRRWARTLSAEFKSGACHAGRYETSLVLASRPELVRQDTQHALPAVTISLSDGIKQGLSTFRAMGMDRAYTGAPAEASVDEGREQLGKLAEMIEAEVREHLGL